MADAERFMVVAFTQQWPEGQPLASWPQHMTVTPWMTGDRLATIGAITDIAAEFEPLEVRIASIEQFGDTHEIPVWTLGPRELLVGLHNSVVSRIGEAASLDAETYTGDTYSPHMTTRPTQPRHELGEQLVLPTLSVIGKIAGQKIIYKNISLHGKRQS